MKTIILLALLTSMNAFAATINLMPGASATITSGETTTVTCQGTADLLPHCAIKLSNNGFFEVYIGADRVSFPTTNENALNAIKTYKLAGLCR